MQQKLYSVLNRSRFMTVNCKIELEYASDEEANVVMESISPDNFNYVNAYMEGKKVIVSSSPDTPMQMLHTMEDLLACIKIAEMTFDAASGE